MNDIEVGRAVPPKELERLMPPLTIPDEPVTIEQATEQGARDAALYFAQLSQFAFQQRSNAALKSIDWEYCNNCHALIESFDKYEHTTNIFWGRPHYEVAGIKKREWAFPLYIARITFRWSHRTITDSTSSEVQEYEVEGSTDSFFGVGFYDGRWRAVFMNLSEEPDFENN